MTTEITGTFVINVKMVKHLQVPYENLADVFERERKLSTTKKHLWHRMFEKHLDLHPNSHVLDIGCGTGRFAKLIVDQFQCAVIGIDPSSAMLAKAKAKCSRDAKWIQGIGETLPFSDDIFDICLASQVVQHFQNIHQAFSEMYRVLVCGGRLGIRISSYSQLETILDYRFFPSALQIEYERLPDIPVLKGILQIIGFFEMHEHTVSQPLFESVDDYLEKLRNRYASFLFLIPEDEYRRGLEKAVEYFNEHEATDGKFAEITFLVCIK